MSNDLTGRKFGRLTVVERMPTDYTHKDKHIVWKCLCSCGNTTYIRSNQLLQNKTVSCGCYNRENTIHRNISRKSPSVVVIDGDVAYIQMNHDAVAVIDAVFADICKDYKWHIDSNGYVSSHRGRETIKLHRLIMKPAPDLVIDHISGDKLDNRLSNLRICSKGENALNRKAPSNSSSGHKGVNYMPTCDKWRVRVQLQGKRHHIGVYDSYEEACIRQEQAERELHGEFSYCKSRGL